MRRERELRYWVYVLGSLSGTLYIGVTSNLSFRVRQHKEHTFRGFTARYMRLTGCCISRSLAKFRDHRAREKQLKGWIREKKIALIEKSNSERRDLSRGWYDKPVRTTFQG